MKCFLLCTVVLIAAAGCGSGSDGIVSRRGARDPAPVVADDPNTVSPDTYMRAYSAYARVFGEDTARTCLAAWADEQNQQSTASDPVYKPNITDFKRFLCDCAGGQNCPDF
jgi:hypothetical protein